MNAAIEHLLQFIGTQHCITTAYSKEENSMTERAIKEVKRHVIALVNDVTSNELDYKQYIPLVMRIMNTTTSELTKLRPCDLLYSKSVNPDRGIIMPWMK